jgi:hypothetical protein
MTVIKTVTHDCPECGHTQGFLLHESLNVTLDPSLREKLFQGLINVFRCDGCDFTAFVDHPLLYHDMNLAFSVQYYPVSYLDDDEFFKIYRKDGSIFFGSFTDHYVTKPHLVFDIDEMLRYITFREKVIELGQE